MPSARSLLSAQCNNRHQDYSYLNTRASSSTLLCSHRPFSSARSNIDTSTHLATRTDTRYCGRSESEPMTLTFCPLLGAIVRPLVDTRQYSIDFGRSTSRDDNLYYVIVTVVPSLWNLQQQPLCNRRAARAESHQLNRNSNNGIIQHTIC
ncbi:hypothetical protein RRG08_001813 [Elysia crispata]|uniref:Uncharacterized protein n=1 Tax=Elysia crispata TaxID=231223 RepID=A0AAE0Y802_9GAST|nr:hypothetical protein RRG08_001813 [Elysia crispata]